MAEITQDQVDQALDLLLRHTRHARSNGFIGDNRERSADILRSVGRLDDDEVTRQYKICQALARYVPTAMIPREKRTDLYDVGHELHREWRARIKDQKDKEK